MKSLIDSLFIAVSMYSSVPVPYAEWNNRNMRNAMCFFPLVGAFCGAVLIALWKICILININPMLFGAFAVLANVIITGGIHIDGFCDTSDALLSRRPQEEKLKILKDPHCGSFAVLSLIMAVLVSYASYVSIYEKPEIIKLAALNFMLSRALSGISVTAFRCASSSTLAKLFSESSAGYVRYILIAEAAAVSAAMIIICGFSGLVAVIVDIAVFIFYRRMSYREFGGITGDTAGYFLTLSETLVLMTGGIL